MKKLFLISTIFLMAFTLNFAQKGAMKVEPSLVIASSHTGTGMGFGANGTFFYGINKQIDLTGTLGYISWSYDGWDGNLTTVPVLFGARYSFGDKSGFTPYASAELGFHFMSFSYEVAAIPGWTTAQTFSESSTEFGLGVGGGIYYNIGNTTLDANVQYNSMDGSFFSVELGALFAL